MTIDVVNVVHELAENDKASNGINYNYGTSEPINEDQNKEVHENGVDAEIAGTGCQNSRSG